MEKFREKSFPLPFWWPSWWGLSFEGSHKSGAGHRQSDGSTVVGAAAVKYGRLVRLDACCPADPSVSPGPLTHLSLPDHSEARPQSGADGRSLLGSWTR